MRCLYARVNDAEDRMLGQIDRQIARERENPELRRDRLGTTRLVRPAAKKVEPVVETTPVESFEDSSRWNDNWSFDDEPATSSWRTPAPRPMPRPVVQGKQRQKVAKDHWGKVLHPSPAALAHNEKAELNRLHRLDNKGKIEEHSPQAQRLEVLVARDRARQELKRLRGRAKARKATRHELDELARLEHQLKQAA